MAHPYAQETSDGGRWQLRQIERPDAIDPWQRPEPGWRHTPSNGFVSDHHTGISMHAAKHWIPGSNITVLGSNPPQCSLVIVSPG
jgi:hypothetical protein